MIDRNALDGDGPLYQQLARALGQVMGGGGAGDRLPSSRELAFELELSRNTVRAAYDVLKAERLLRTRRGAGSFAHSPQVAVSPQPVSATTPRSAFAKRIRALGNRAVRLGRLHRGLRFNLQYGEPLTDVLFSEVWRRELGRAAARTPYGYPESNGLSSLREAICGHLWRRRGLRTTPDDVIVVAGTQQALSLSARVLVDDGQAIVLENPCYFFARDVMQVHGARIVPVDVDRDGLDTARLPPRGVRLICVTPSHHFPLGAVLAPARRAALLAYAQKHDTFIVEDDYDAEFRFDRRVVAPLRVDDRHDRVIHVGSFSKSLAPALRLGYMVVPRALRGDFIVAKQLADLGAPTVEQAALASFIAGGGFDRHMRRVLKSLTQRRAALLDGLARHARQHMQVVDFGAGMHLLALLRDGSAEREAQLIDAARHVGLGLHPLSSHYLCGPRAYGLLLGYAGVAPAQINAACKALGRCLADL